MSRRFTIFGLVAVLSLSVVACGASTSNATGSGTGATTAAAAATSFNDADVTFASGMIPHHEQAIAMADIALDPKVGASAKVVDLATRIKQAQDPEIKLMAGWLKAWNKPAAMASSGGHAMSATDGMMTDTEMTGLGAARGTTFDRMFYEFMIQHHQGAVTMAETVKTAGKNAEVKTLADQIIKAQRAEITEMQASLGK